ncbi:MAG: hypothetical protein P8Y54_09585 [Xanthomonadales bacterium]
MKFSARRSIVFCSAFLALGASSLASAETLFFDDFEDRVEDQAKIGNDWTWYDQWFAGDSCEGEATGGFGPFDDGDGSDYEQDNRNFFFAGEDDSYYRAGLEVPAWDGALSNMLRVYGNQYIEQSAGFCQRVLIFQEMEITAAEVGPMLFSFDVAKDQNGAPANGEITGAFVKVLKASDGSYDTVLFERVETLLPENMLTDMRYVEFEVTEELVGELLQFGFYNDVVPDLGQSWGTSAALYDNVTLETAFIGPGHSGSWNNEPQRGHGFSMEFGLTFEGNPYAVIYWYIYDDAGNPIFMVGQGTPEGNRVEVTFYSPVGMVYGDFDPSAVPNPLDIGGTGVFEFSDSENGTFSYTPSEFSETTWGHTTPVENLELSKFFGVPAEPIFPAPAQ